MSLEYEKVTHIIQVRRGTMRVNFPFSNQGLKETDPSMLAHSAVAGLIRLQFAFTDRDNPDPIDVLGKVPIVLKLPDRDGSLQPDLSLERQLEGKWEVIDAEKIVDLGVGGVQEIHGRCSFVILELVESLRAI